MILAEQDIKICANGVLFANIGGKEYMIDEDVLFLVKQGTRRDTKKWVKWNGDYKTLVRSINSGLYDCRLIKGTIVDNQTLIEAIIEIY